MDFIVIFISLFTNIASASECKDWFQTAQIKKGDNCLLDCSMAEVDMGTFQCHNMCDTLCNSSVAKQFIFRISRLYGLNKAERVLTAKHPIKMFNAYTLSWKAEKWCLSLFIKNHTNDASDACRHFVWATLLYKKFGLKFSKKVLNAHEKNSKQPLKEKQMDIANNQLGLQTAQYLIKQNQFNKSTILKNFQDNLNEGNIVIIKLGAKRRK